MSSSPLREPFLRELADKFVGAQRSLARRLAGLDNEDAASRDAIIREELRGLFHGVLVIFDGGTALADKGLVQIIDEDGEPFDRFLYEIGFRYWPSGDVA
ncbi:MAG: hypothetical protein SFU86_22775 [Pirellulaceae bacterium]|nr:hypothetical protein [Pirellulaceae bacterium]